MRDLKTYLILILTIGIFATSCKKDSDDPVPTPTDLLTIESGWQSDGFTTNTDEILESFVDLVFQLLDPEDQTPENRAALKESFGEDFEFIEESDPCEEDDVIFFNTDGTVTQNTGSVKCDASEPDERDGGTWALSSDAKTLTLADDGDSFGYEVTTLSSSKLELTIREPLTSFVDEEDLEDIQGFEGYDDLIGTEVILTFIFKAN